MQVFADAVNLTADQVIFWIIQCCTTNRYEANGFIAGSPQSAVTAVEFIDHCLQLGGQSPVINRAAQKKQISICYLLYDLIGIIWQHTVAAVAFTGITGDTAFDVPLSHIAEFNLSSG